ncbi:Alpha-catulin [Cichlidogyrus casuarinus]|uniref:Alpha-catulin n=1 Tax=Cichlidogyrus casuarinus TaxID=1844966 RepID=A0ABD2QH08_9PLAT
MSNEISHLVAVCERTRISESTVRSLRVVCEHIKTTVDTFSQAAEKAVSEFPELHGEMGRACTEAKLAGRQLSRNADQYCRQCIELSGGSMTSSGAIRDSSCDTITERLRASGEILKSSNDDHCASTNESRSKLIKIARRLLFAVVYTLLVADKIIAKRLQLVKVKILTCVQQMQWENQFPGFLKAFSDFGATIVEFGKLSGDRQKLCLRDPDVSNTWRLRALLLDHLKEYLDKVIDLSSTVIPESWFTKRVAISELSNSDQIGCDANPDGDLSKACDDLLDSCHANDYNSGKLKMLIENLKHESERACETINRRLTQSRSPSREGDQMLDSSARHLQLLDRNLEMALIDAITKLDQEIYSFIYDKASSHLMSLDNEVGISAGNSLYPHLRLLESLKPCPSPSDNGKEAMKDVLQYEYGEEFEEASADFRQYSNSINEVCVLLGQIAGSKELSDICFLVAAYVRSLQELIQITGKIQQTIPASRHTKDLSIGFRDVWALLMTDAAALLVDIDLFRETGEIHSATDKVADDDRSAVKTQIFNNPHASRGSSLRRLLSSRRSRDLSNGAANPTNGSNNALSQKKTPEPQSNSGLFGTGPYLVTCLTQERGPESGRNSAQSNPTYDYRRSTLIDPWTEIAQRAGGPYLKSNEFSRVTGENYYGNNGSMPRTRPLASSFDSIQTNQAYLNQIRAPPREFQNPPRVPLRRQNSAASEFSALGQRKQNLPPQSDKIRHLEQNLNIINSEFR